MFYDIYSSKFCKNCIHLLLTYISIYYYRYRSLNMYVIIVYLLVDNLYLYSYWFTYTLDHSFDSQFVQFCSWSMTFYSYGHSCVICHHTYKSIMYVQYFIPVFGLFSVGDGGLLMLPDVLIQNKDSPAGWCRERILLFIIYTCIWMFCYYL